LPFSISGIGQEYLNQSYIQMPNWIVSDKITDLQTGNYPLERWSDQVIDTLNMVDDELVLFMLDDYWLMQPADMEMLAHGCEILHKTENLWAYDASWNTPYDEDKLFVRHIYWHDAFLNNNRYAYSYQAYVWKRDKLISTLRRGESPWQAEILGLERMGNPNRVFSFEKPAIVYANVMIKGQWDFVGEHVVPQRTLSEGDWEELKIFNYV